MIPTPKHTIRFHADGSLRLLMLSDIQDTLNYDERTLRGIELMLDELRPDLVIWGGDNIDGRKLKTREELQKYLAVFAEPMERRRIPWMHVYGNHDYDADVPAAEQQAMYEAYPMCISSHTEGIPGVSNYMIPILAHDSDRVAYAIYAFDSKYKDVEMRPGIGKAQLLLPVREQYCKKWDTIRFEQQLWYWQLSRELEQREGHLVPAMAVMHVPPQEIMMTINNPAETGYTGFSDEEMHCPMLNSGVYATMLERGDIEIIAAGHIHSNTCDGVYGGIRLTLDACAGFAPPSVDERRGGRVFELREDGGHKTYMFTLAEHMEI